MGDAKISCNNFVGYFCNDDVMDYLEKQTAWHLLVKCLDVFDKVYSTHCGVLRQNEFKQFGKMLNLNDKETEVLFITVDKDGSGEITILKLFEWLKLKMELVEDNELLESTVSSEYESY